MTTSSAGILMYRRTGKALEVLLVHPGGPFWHNKDDGAWSIPKGEMDEGEDPAEAALREFMEEIGSAPEGPLCSLGEIVQRGGNRVYPTLMSDAPIRLLGMCLMVVATAKMIARTNATENAAKIHRRD
jgi:predicted NUDIX family NTP pyrophosphohydrolase